MIIICSRDCNNHFYDSENSQEIYVYSIENKNIIVTGATSGIGKLLTEQLSYLGANIAFCGHCVDKMRDVVAFLDNTQAPSYLCRRLTTNQ